MKQHEVGEAYEASTSALEAARGQRLSLRRAIGGLEEALAVTDSTVKEVSVGAVRYAGSVAKLLG